MRESEKQQPVFTAEQVRQGEIILRRPWQRYVFFGSLVAMALLVLILGMLAGATQ